MFCAEECAVRNFEFGDHNIPNNLFWNQEKPSPWIQIQELWFLKIGMDSMQLTFWTLTWYACFKLSCLNCNANSQAIYSWILYNSFEQMFGSDSVYYFHDMIVEMRKWGFEEGKTLFGFGYDFRQSNRYLINLKLEQFYKSWKRSHLPSHR